MLRLHYAACTTDSPWDSDAAWKRRSMLRLYLTYDMFCSAPRMKPNDSAAPGSGSLGSISYSN